MLANEGNVFEEIKKFRRISRNFSSRIDNKVGANAIANQFASIYENLYNRVELDNEFYLLQENIALGVNEESQKRLEQVNEALVRKAVDLLKPNNRDALYDMSSDYYKNAPPELISHLTNLIKIYLTHGYVPHVILLCSLIPIVKDNLGDITSSENYRAIAGGCLLLKLIDLVIILLEGDKLSFDCMQFAYQVKSSTTMCTWTTTAVIDYFN